MNVNNHKLINTIAIATNFECKNQLCLYILKITFSITTDDVVMTESQNFEIFIFESCLKFLKITSIKIFWLYGNLYYIILLTGKPLKLLFL